MTVEPDAFVLQGNSDPAPNVTMLCNAFKVGEALSKNAWTDINCLYLPQSTYVTKMAMAGGNAVGLAARTPYIGRTPNPCERYPFSQFCISLTFIIPQMQAV